MMYTAKCFRGAPWDSLSFAQFSILCNESQENVVLLYEDLYCIYIRRHTRIESTFYVNNRKYNDSWDCLQKYIYKRYFFETFSKNEYFCK